MSIYNCTVIFTNGLTETSQVECESRKEVLEYLISKNYFSEIMQITIVEIKLD